MCSSYPVAGDTTLHIQLRNGNPNSATVLFFGLVSSPLGGNYPSVRRVAITSAAGDAEFQVTPPADPIFAGSTFQGIWAVRDMATPGNFSRTQLVRWVLE